MKKKLIMALLALSIAVMAAGCGDKKSDKSKDDDKKTETSAEDTAVDTNSKGKVVAVDVDDISKYVKLGDYKNLEVTETKTEITDADVEDYISQQLTYKAEEITEDRPVQENDTVNIDYTGYLDGEAFDGGSATDSDLLIGSNSFIDGFESGLIGKSKGEEVTLDLTFPDPYSNNPDLAGKPVQFKVKINAIKAAPELTDEWVKNNTDKQTVDEYKEEIKNSLKENAYLNYMSQLKSDLFQKVVESSEITEYPEKPMSETMDYVKNKIQEQYASPSGMTLEEYWESQSISTEQAEETMTQMAQNILQQSLIVQAIFDAEKVEISVEDYEAELEKFAKDYGFKDAEALKSAYSDETMVKANVLWSKSCEILQETAKVTYVPADAQNTGDGDAKTE